ncbi:MAG: ATP-grasp domain-containing protein [Candidatus Kapaibacterium sp.]
MNILILGVGNAQLDAIKYLKDRGHTVHALSYKREGPGISYADKFTLIDIRDHDSINKYSAENGIGLIYSVGSDLAMPSVAQVSNDLGLPVFFKKATVDIFIYKLNFRKFLKSEQIEIPEFMPAETKASLKKWDKYPAVVKPVDSQGQRGVSMVKDTTMLEEAFDNAAKYSDTGSIMIESYIRGKELSANVFMDNGELKYCIITNRKSPGTDYFGHVKCHTLPGDINKDDRLFLKNLVKNICLKAGLLNGPAYFQLKKERNRLVVIEAAPRLDGCHLWRLIKYGTGIDLLDLTFKKLMGESIDYQPARDTIYPMTLEYSLHKPGTVYQESSPETKKEILFSREYYKKGEKIRPINGILEKTGYYIY